MDGWMDGGGGRKWREGGGGCYDYGCGDLDSDRLLSLRSRRGDGG